MRYNELQYTISYNIQWYTIYNGIQWKIIYNDIQYYNEYNEQWDTMGYNIQWATMRNELQWATMPTMTPCLIVVYLIVLQWIQWLQYCSSFLQHCMSLLQHYLLHEFSDERYWYNPARHINWYKEKPILKYILRWINIIMEKYILLDVMMTKN